MIQDWQYSAKTLQWEYLPADAVVLGGSVITQECGCTCQPCATIYNGPHVLETKMPGHCLAFPCTGGKRLWTAFWDGKRIGEDTNPEAAMRLVEQHAEQLRRRAEVEKLEGLG